MSSSRPPFLAMSTLGITWSILFSCCQSPRSSMAKSQSLTQLQPHLGPLRIVNLESWQVDRTWWVFSVSALDHQKSRLEPSWRAEASLRWTRTQVTRECRWVVWSFVAANHVLPQFATSKVWCRRFLFCLFAYSFSLQDDSQIELA